MTSPNRSDPDKHKEQMRRASQARYAATRRLQAAHPAEWAALYEEEAHARGVTPSLSHEVRTPMTALYDVASKSLANEEAPRRKRRPAHNGV